MQMIRSEAIKHFLRHSTSPIAKLYNSNMEVQVQVAQDDGERFTGKSRGVSWQGFRDPSNHEDVWKHFRMPLGANTETPKDNDSPMFFDLASHVEGIGMTGWDWKGKVSRWVGYDFDSIVNHKAGISTEDLNELMNKCLATEGLSVLRSTSGHGYHIYIFFDEPVPAQTHNEHAAIARALLSVLTTDTGFDFQAKVDCVGSILWAWHRKSEGTEGLSWVKEGGKFPATRVPANWKDHLKVVRGKARRTDLGSGKMQEISASMSDVELLPSHRTLLKWLGQNSKQVFYWDIDHRLLVAHTHDLLRAKEALELKGLFDTSSTGSSEQNCFAFPLADGGWVVRRFGLNVQEHQSWVIDEAGWTKTYLDVKPTFDRAARFFSGVENRQGGFEFDNLDQCALALQFIDLDFGYTPEMARVFGERPVTIEYSQKKSKVFIIVKKHPEDNRIVGWISGKSTWEKVLRYSEDATDSQILNVNIDDWCRHTTSGDESAGWFIFTNGKWVQQSDASVKAVLAHLIPEATGGEITQIIGKSIINPWEFDNAPFEDEYPGGRVWNRQGAKLAFEPKQGLTPTWDDLFNHVGKSLNEPVHNDKWCRSNGIYTGGDFLRYWLSSVLQKPEQQLPYLFFTGEQGTGKSSFHEAIELLFEQGRGYMFADSALKNPSGFNSELYGAVVCVVEEVDLSASKTAYNRLKDWVTAESLAINTKYKNIFKSRNFMHWIQTGNSPRNVPIFDGDTRVIVTQVFRLSKDIPKKMFLKQLREEAPAILYNLMNMEIGSPFGRLGMPVLETALKQSIVESNFTPLDRYVKEECTVIKGVYTSLDDFHAHFRTWLINNDYIKDIRRYEKLKLRSEFPEKGILCMGTGENGDTVIANLVLNVADVEALKIKFKDSEPLTLNEEGIIC